MYPFAFRHPFTEKQKRITADWLTLHFNHPGLAEVYYEEHCEEIEPVLAWHHATRDLWSRQARAEALRDALHTPEAARSPEALA